MASLRAISASARRCSAAPRSTLVSLRQLRWAWAARSQACSACAVLAALTVAVMLPSAGLSTSLRSALIKVRKANEQKEFL